MIYIESERNAFEHFLFVRTALAFEEMNGKWTAQISIEQLSLSMNWRRGSGSDSGTIDNVHSVFFSALF